MAEQASGANLLLDCRSRENHGSKVGQPGSSTLFSKNNGSDTEKEKGS